MQMYMCLCVCSVMYRFTLDFWYVVMPAFIQIGFFFSFKHQPFPVCVGDKKKSIKCI